MNTHNMCFVEKFEKNSTYIELLKILPLFCLHLVSMDTVYKIDP